MEPEQKRLTILQMVASVLASFFGVQSSKNRIRDFKLGRARDFIIVGIILTAFWYGAIYGLVQLLLSD
ncbi:MAG: hypothetical protein ACI9WS_001133 [Paraglaciecola psychrophila]|jgi:hypothetical protein